MPKRTDNEIIADLRLVDSRLSPENLSHDGELSQAKVKARRKKLCQQQANLLTELGRSPTAQELYDY